MNKKAEGRISTFIITIVLALGSIVLVSNLVNEFTGEYNVKDVSEFANYTDRFDEMEAIGESVIQSQNEKELDNEGFWNSLRDKFENWWEQQLIIRAWNTLKIFPKMGSVTTKSINGAMNSAGFAIPTYMKITIYLLIGITLVLLIVKAIWEKKI